MMIFITKTHNTQVIMDMFLIDQLIKKEYPHSFQYLNN